jgi:hypothetical protein
MLGLTPLLVMSLIHAAMSADNARMLRMEGQALTEKLDSPIAPTASLDSDFGADLGGALGQTSDFREPWNDGHESHNQQKAAFPPPKLPGGETTGSSLGAAAAAVAAAAGLAGVEPSKLAKPKSSAAAGPIHAAKFPAYHKGEKVADYVAKITGREAKPKAMGQLIVHQVPNASTASTNGTSLGNSTVLATTTPKPAPNLPWDSTKVYPTSLQTCFGSPGGCVTNGGFELQMTGQSDIRQVPWSWKGYPHDYIHLVRGSISTSDGGYAAQLFTGAVLKQEIKNLHLGKTYQVNVKAACATLCGASESLSVDVGPTFSIRGMSLVHFFQDVSFSFVATSKMMQLTFTSGDGTPMRSASVDQVPSTSVYIDQIQIQLAAPPVKPVVSATGQQTCTSLECCRAQCASQGYCCNEDITKSKEGKLSCVQACVLKVLGYDHDGFCPSYHCHGGTDPRCLYDVGSWRFPILNLFEGCEHGGGKGGTCKHDSGCDTGMAIGVFNPDTTVKNISRTVPHVGINYFGGNCGDKCKDPGPCPYCGPAGACCSQMGDFKCNNYLKDLQKLVPFDLPPVEAETVGARCVPASDLPVTKMKASRLTCQQLNWTQFMGRVPMEYTAAGRGVSAATNGLDHFSDVGGPVTPKKIQDELLGRAITKCPPNGGKMRFADAVRYCADAGARLCTAKELQLDVAKWTGCDMDRQRVWSATECDHGRGFTTLAGAHMYSEALGGHQCGDPASEQGVRCCCDEEENTCGLNDMNMDSVVKKCGTLPHDCMFLVTADLNSTCGTYCKRHNLDCLGAWVPVINDPFEVTCIPKTRLDCDTTRSNAGDPGRHVICECDVPASVGGVPSSAMYGSHYGRPADCNTATSQVDSDDSPANDDNFTGNGTSNGTGGYGGYNGSSAIALAGTGKARAGKGGRAHSKLNAGQTFQEEETDEQLEKELNEGLDGSDVESGETDDDYYYEHSPN